MLAPLWCPLPGRPPRRPCPWARSRCPGSAAAGPRGFTAPPASRAARRRTMTSGIAGLPFGPGGRVPPADLPRRCRRRSGSAAGRSRPTAGCRSRCVTAGLLLPVPAGLPDRQGRPVVVVPGDRGRQQPGAVRLRRAARREGGGGRGGGGLRRRQRVRRPIACRTRARPGRRGRSRARASGARRRSPGRRCGS